MTTETLTADRWVDEFTHVSNEDPEIQAHGKYYTCSFLLDMEEHQFLIRMNAGKVEEILVDPGPWISGTSSSSAPARRRGATSARRRRRRCTTGSGRPHSRET